MEQWKTTTFFFLFEKMPFTFTRRSDWTGYRGVFWVLENDRDDLYFRAIRYFSGGSKLFGFPN